jgi:hypothetical protein
VHFRAEPLAAADAAEVKERLPHGQFIPWIEREFAWSERATRRFMEVHERVKTANLADLNIDVSALYLIAAPSTPEPVRQQVITRAAKCRVARHFGSGAVCALTEQEKSLETKPSPREWYDEDFFGIETYTSRKRKPRCKDCDQTRRDSATDAAEMTGLYRTTQKKSGRQVTDAPVPR